MSHAVSIRRLAAALALGGGGLGALGFAGFGVLKAEARMARRTIGQPFGQVGPDASGTFGPPAGTPWELAVIGDSTAVGLGADGPADTPGALLADGLSAVSGRPVRVTVVAVVGAESSHLAEQLDRLFAERERIDIALVMVGANDVTHRISLEDAAADLGTTVRRLRERDVEVVVGTCPDLGTIKPLAQPLRWVARWLSRRLAAAQTVAVVRAGGRTVSLGDLLGREFARNHHEMFSSDRFHPSSTGYARAAAVLLPSMAEALGLVLPTAAADVRAGEGVDDVTHAAVRAAREAGTEVTGVAVAGSELGPRGRWTMLRRRRRSDVEADADAATTSSSGHPRAGARSAADRQR